MSQPAFTRVLDRRRFLALGAMAACALGAAPAHALGAGQRSLSFRHLHTGERLTATYWADGTYVGEALARIDRLLRDFRTDEVKAIDPRLLDLLNLLGRKMDSRTPFEVISGYRSPATNATLAAAGHGVATKSLHLRGMAIDVRLPGRRLKDLHRAALALRGGGVGYYPATDFVHVDVGRVRSW
ncbi:MAG: DUF882 domain-containing protein [Dongiaceae bacterium]